MASIEINSYLFLICTYFLFVPIEYLCTYMMKSIRHLCEREIKFVR
jgi:hypothetical protein